MLITVSDFGKEIKQIDDPLNVGIVVEIPLDTGFYI